MVTFDFSYCFHNVLYPRNIFLMLGKSTSFAISYLNFFHDTEKILLVISFTKFTAYT